MESGKSNVMKAIIHKSESRGHFNHGWLKTWHTFSFADYFDRSRMNFGVMRVLNDDIVRKNNGFGMHPHQNMEILTVILSGEITHKDSFGHQATIGKNEIQVMSAGTGIYHSEINKSLTEDCHLLQLWFLPEKQNLNPRYEQRKLNPDLFQNKIDTFVAPFGHNTDLSLHQDVWVSRLDAVTIKEYTYNMHSSENGLYIFVLEGKLEIEGHILNRRDGIGISDARTIKFVTTENTQIIIFEVKMKQQ